MTKCKKHKSCKNYNHHDENKLKEGIYFEPPSNINQCFCLSLNVGLFTSAWNLIFFPLVLNLICIKKSSLFFPFIYNRETSVEKIKKDDKFLKKRISPIYRADSYIQKSSKSTRYPFLFKALIIFWPLPNDGLFSLERVMRLIVFWFTPLHSFNSV